MFKFIPINSHFSAHFPRLLPQNVVNVSIKSGHSVTYGIVLLMLMTPFDFVSAHDTLPPPHETGVRPFKLDIIFDNGYDLNASFEGKLDNTNPNIIHSINNFKYTITPDAYFPNPTDTYLGPIYLGHPYAQTRGTNLPSDSHLSFDGTDNQLDLFDQFNSYYPTIPRTPFYLLSWRLYLSNGISSFSASLDLMDIPTTFDTAFPTGVYMLNYTDLLASSAINHKHNYSISSVPIPTTALLYASGLLVFCKFRKKNQAQHLHETMTANA